MAEEINLDHVTHWYRIGLDDGLAGVRRLINVGESTQGMAILHAYVQGQEHGADLRRRLGVPDED